MREAPHRGTRGARHFTGSLPGAAILLYCSLIWAVLLFHPLRDTALKAVDDGAIGCSALFATVLSIGHPARIWRRLRGDGDRRASYEWSVGLLGLGLLASTIGEGLWTVYETVLHTPPFPSWADAAYLCFYPFLLAGTLLLPIRSVPGVTRARVGLDGLMIMVAAVTFSWYFLLAPTLQHGGESLLAKAVGTAYPLGDLLLIACLLLLQMHAGARALRPAIILLSLGLGCVIVADCVFDYQSLQGTYTTGSLIDPVWALGYLLIGLGARQARRPNAVTDREQSAAMPAPRRTLWWTLVPYAVFPAVGALVVYTHSISGDESREGGVYLGGTILILLIILRQFVMILENQRLYSRLVRRERHLQTVVSSAPVILFALDQNGRYTLVEGTALDALDVRAADVIGHSISDTHVPLFEDHASIRRALDGQVCIGRSLLAGHMYEVHYQPVRNSDGTPGGAIGVAIDITERSQAEDALRHQALHDALTGLPNRTFLTQQLTQVLAGAQAGDEPTTLLLVDLDRFKEVNDTLGHHVGDLVLQHIGTRMREALRATDTVARLGGDEFGILLPATDEAGGIHVAQILLNELNTAICITDHLLDVGASIGIASTTDAATDAGGLLRRADVAMYVAKRTHSGYACYEPNEDQRDPGRLALGSALRRALDMGDLAVYYQPKVALVSGQVCGVEALIRWPQADQDFIPPDQFIPIAEHTGLIAPLTVWVLQTALRQVLAWHRRGIEVGMAVNLSAHLLHENWLPATIADLLQEYAIDPGRLTLEITESALMVDPEHATEVLDRLSQLGIRIAIDDFGTGYSSLGYLRHLQVDEIKIDKSFILGLGTTPDATDVAIVRSIIQMARALGHDVVAEGVEHGGAWDVLQTLGCTNAQGYYLSRPLPAAEVERWMQESAWSQSQATA